MTDEDFDLIRKLLREQSAIVLDDDKQYLVEARLAPLVRERQLGSIGGAHRRRFHRPSSQRSRASDRRSHGHDRDLVLPRPSTLRDIEENGHPRVDRAAARRTNAEHLVRRKLQRTGTLQPGNLDPRTFPQLLGWKIKLLASDLSREMTTRTREGRYSQIEVNRGLPAALLVKYFEQHGTTWQLSPTIRAMVDFQEINLAEPWPWLPPMDLVMLRNVMIYFGIETKKTILGRVSRLLRSDGYLVTGRRGNNVQSG